MLPGLAVPGCCLVSFCFLVPVNLEPQFRGLVIAISCKGCLWPRAATASPRRTGGKSRSPNTLEPAYMVHGYKVFWHIRSILWWSKFVLALLPYNPLLWSIFLGPLYQRCRSRQRTGHTGRLTVVKSVSLWMSAINKG